MLCYGIFNVLHIGHIRYLKQAGQLGDILVVVLTPDRPMDKHNQQRDNLQRAEALAHLDWIDAVTVNTRRTWKEMMQELGPDVYAKGFESVQADNQFEYQKHEREFFRELGIESVIIKEESFFSTGQINRYLSDYSDEVLNYVHLFKKRYTIQDVLQPLEQAKDLNILVIGDTILDEYQYCTTIGKSSKDPMLALKFESKDLFAGGVLAVANHVANFAGRVHLITMLGEDESYESFIRSRLHQEIQPSFIYKPNAPTLIKRRIVDGYSMNKLLEIYFMEDSPLHRIQDQELCNIIEKKLSGFDLVVIADYGHGVVTKNLISILSDSPCYIAVNTQSNAGNRGYNTISKYPRADFVSLAEHEIRLETRDLIGRLFPMIQHLAESMSSRQFVVTRGKKGCMLYDRSHGLIQVPGFAQNVVDRVGAGDALFAITSMCAALGIPGEVLGFLGSVTGTLAVETMGNQKSIEKTRIEQYIYNLLS